MPYFHFPYMGIAANVDWGLVDLTVQVQFRAFSLKSKPNFVILLVISSHQSTLAVALQIAIFSQSVWLNSYTSILISWIF